MSTVTFLKTLQEVIQERVENPTKDSYTARMAAKGELKVAQKLGEEAVELALASVSESAKRVKYEAADLLYHLLLLLTLREISIDDVVEELKKRHKQ